MKTPRVPGYKVANRADRKGGRRGGGLLTYIKDIVAFEKGSMSSTRGTEVTSIRVRLTKSTWTTISNVYVPPHNTTGEAVAFIPDHIPTPSDAIITGDFNAHSPLWDEIQPADSRGEDIEAWTMLQELAIMNNSGDCYNNALDHNALIINCFTELHNVLIIVSNSTLSYV